MPEEDIRSYMSEFNVTREEAISDIKEIINKYKELENEMYQELIRDMH